MAFPAGWSRKCPIAIDDAKVGTGGVSAFAVLLTRANLPDEMCSPSDSNRAQSDGGDIRFSSDSDGATQLPLEIDNFAYDTSHGADDANIRLHVKVPAIADSGDTTIYVWYKASTTQAQPASTDTYGAKNVWDSDHCHRYSFDQSVGGSAPQFTDSVGGRHATVKGTGSSSVTGQHGNAVDGNGTGYTQGPPSGFVVPLKADNSVPFTNTGACYIPGDDRLGLGNFTDQQIVEVEKDGTEVNRFSVATEMGGTSAIQGLAYDSADDVFFAVNFAGATIYKYQRNGTYVTSFSYTGAANAVGYDAIGDCLWVIGDNTASAKKLRSINKATGATIATINISGAANIAGAYEGVCHDADSDSLWVTENNARNIFQINKSTGATIQTVVGVYDQEHLAYDTTDGCLWINGDSRFHSGVNLGESICYKLTTAGKPVDWNYPDSGEYSLEWWWKPDNVSVTAIVLSMWAAVETTAFYIEVQTRVGGVVRIFETDVTFVDTPASTVATGSWNYWRLTYDANADTLTLYKNEVQVAQATSAVFVCGPDGRIGIGSRPNGDLKHNGAIDEVRLHRSRRSAAWWATRYNNTNAASTFAAAGTPIPITEGTLSATLGAVTTTAAGTVSVSGAAALTLGAVTTTATGAVAVVGDVTRTLGAVTIAGEGTVGDVPVEGSLSATLGAVTGTATGTVDVAGAVSVTLGALQSTAAGAVAIDGSSTVTLGTLTLSAEGGALGINGSFAVTLSALALQAAGGVDVTGALSATLGALTSFDQPLAPYLTDDEFLRVPAAALYLQAPARDLYLEA